MKIPSFLWTVIFSVLWCNCYSYRILGVFPLNSRSHFIVFERLMKSLADRGHLVDVISSFPQLESYPNYSDIPLPPVYPSLHNNVTYHDITEKIVPVIKLVKTERGNNVCHALGFEKLKKIIDNPPKDPQYDAVITEVMIANCFLSIGYLLNVPVIGVSTYGRLPWVYDMAGNVDSFDFIPEEPYGSNHLDFWKRISTVVSNAYQKWSFYHATNPQNAILNKYFGKKLPPLRELESNIALVITNAHVTTHGVKPITPGIVELGGMHVVDKYVPPLFYDIKDYLDESKDGAVYFNLGEDLVFESLPLPIIQSFYNVFEKLQPMKILMRVSKHQALPKGLPTNVVTVPWVQQFRVLQHENVRAFVTHGGLLGLQEAFHTGVPVLGIPLGGDQFDNVDLCVKKTIGVRLDLDNINEKTLQSAFNKVLHNSTLRANMKAFSKRFNDRKSHPMDLANYWIEYVIQHGSDSLKSPITQLSWYQRAYFDIYTLFLVAFALLVVTTFIVIRKIVKAIFSKCRRPTKMQKLL